LEAHVAVRTGPAMGLPAVLRRKASGKIQWEKSNAGRLRVARYPGTSGGLCGKSPLSVPSLAPVRGGLTPGLRPGLRNVVPG